MNVKTVRRKAALEVMGVLRVSSTTNSTASELTHLDTKAAVGVRHSAVVAGKPRVGHFHVHVEGGQAAPYCPRTTNPKLPNHIR